MFVLLSRCNQKEDKGGKKMINIIYAALLLIGAFLVARFYSRNEIITKHNEMLGYFAAGLMVIAAVLYIIKGIN